MRAKKILDKARAAFFSMKAIERQLAEAEVQKGTLRAVDFREHVQTSVGAGPVVAAVEAVENYTLKLIEKKRELYEAHTAAFTLINRLPPGKLNDVLSYRYLSALKWKEVADEMHYSEDYVKELHTAAIAELDGIPHEIPLFDDV